MRRDAEVGSSVPSTTSPAPLLVLPLPPPGCRRGRLLGALTVASAWLWVVAAGWVAVVQVLSCQHWARYPTSGDGPPWATDYHRSILPVVVAAALAWVVAGAWLSRLRSTALRIDPWGQATERWLPWQCWLIPAANCILPVWMLGDVARAVLRRRPRGMTDPVPLVRLWWVAFLAMTATGCAATALTGTTRTEAELIEVLAPAQFVLTLAAATVWVRLVRLLTAAHDRMVAEAEGAARAA